MFYRGESCLKFEIQQLVETLKYSSKQMHKIDLFILMAGSAMNSVCCLPPDESLSTFQRKVDKLQAFQTGY